jgi:hypothetical protein
VINLSHRVTIPASVMVRQVGGETVLLDLESSTYFGLDGVGTRIWQLLAEGRTLESVCDVIGDEYEVERADVERDTVRLVSELEIKGLVQAA